MPSTVMFVTIIVISHNFSLSRSPVQQLTKRIHWLLSVEVLGNVVEELATLSVLLKIIFRSRVWVLIRIVDLASSPAFFVVMLITISGQMNCPDNAVGAVIEAQCSAAHCHARSASFRRNLNGQINQVT